MTSSDSTKIHHETLANGMTLVVEQMPWLESAAFALLTPAGSASDKMSELGVSNLLCDWVQRGCGNRDSRRFIEDLDNLGVSRGAGVSTSHTSFGGAVLAENLTRTLAIYSDLVQEPHLPEDEFDESQAVCLQELRALEDDLYQQSMLQLRKQMYHDPWGRASYGDVKSVTGLTAATAKSHFETHYRPNGTILAIAGNVDWQATRDDVVRLFGEWKEAKEPLIVETPPEGIYRHIPFESSQTHIGVGFQSIPYSHADYFLARAAVGVLSDGMSSRLFTEVRENRGLCYTVFATMHTLLDRGSVLCYSGTSTERAQETLDVLVGELVRIREGIEESELTRLKARIKSSLVMQQESSSSRASSLASDWRHLGRIRTVDELTSILDGLSCDAINRYLQDNPPHDFRFTTVGAEKLEIPVAVSS
ncbi:M16 family metallopeptidase [Blastopirellula retiformator]|uniref:Peptidase M16 inactive domain protein n=1 Tax=Blastopirellula retiformator TaxID=2527970 RepID=A0A5C5UV37_9BACT|nr:pitrilysin family protein [Blastopirellula retiformator]TWT29302.1 Peptidase M16 inactive domain protein [Blastopirellula retiformator]